MHICTLGERTLKENFKQIRKKITLKNRFALSLRIKKQKNTFSALYIFN